VPRRSTRERRLAIANDYIVYLQEYEFNIGLEDDPTSLNEVKLSIHSTKWLNTMKNELKFMKDNNIWDLVELPNGKKRIGCKWMFKTKLNSKGNFKNIRHVLMQRFTQRKGVDYKETFSPIFIKSSFKIIMELVAHFNLELHQMAVKIVFLKCSIEEEICMVRP